MKSEIKRDPARATGVALEFEDGSFVLIHPYYDFDRNMKVAECFQRALQDDPVFHAKNEMIHSLNQQINELAKRYDRDMAAQEAKVAAMSQALQFYADHGNWLIESEEQGYVNRIEWNASGDLWRAPWKRAEQALAARAV